MTTQSTFIARTGEGVPPLRGSELNRGIMRRIERLGKLNDRRLELEGAGDAAGLLALAAEYESLGRYGCPRMAEGIRGSVAGVRSQVKGQRSKLRRKNGVSEQ